MAFDVRFSDLANLTEVGLIGTYFGTYLNFSVFTDSKIDGVIIGTPTDTHEALCIRALEANKHVLCEALGQL